MSTFHLVDLLSTPQSHCENYYIPMGGTSTAPLPAKDKKKKRSFFEDDDFFVIKKNKKTKSPAPPKSAGEITKESPRKATDTPVQPEIPGEQVDSDDLLQSFHSAKDAFSDDADLPPAQNESSHEVQTMEPVEVEEVSDGLSDDPDSALSKFFKGISSGKTDPSHATEDTARVYLVKIISLHSEITDELQVSGDITFESMVRQVLMSQHWHYNMQEDNVLFWVEGRSELKGFFKPSTLRIPPPARGEPTRVTVFHTLRYRNDDLLALSEQYEQPIDLDEVSIVDQDTSIVEVEEVPAKSPNSPAKPLSEYFRIGLKGKDNKRIECEVGPHTKIRDLLAYYVKVKGVDESTVQNAKLIFDDEVLDLDGTVGDTELEDEFEVQVHI